MILCCFSDRSQVGIPDPVIGVFISSAGPKVAKGCVLDSAHFGQVGVPPGSGPFGDSSGRCADPKCPQDQMVYVVEVLFVLDIGFLWCW